MATFNDQKYIGIAVSKDLGRGPLQYMYRHKDRLIGCDGHRLHMIFGLPLVSEGQYVNAPAATAEYPNYEAAMPEDGKLSYIGNIRFDKDQMKRLKGLVAFCGHGDRGSIKITRDMARDGHLILRHSDDMYSATMELELETDQSGVRHSVDIGVRAQYFYDAIVPDREMEVHVNDNMHLVLRCTYPSVMSYALIMGVRV